MVEYVASANFSLMALCKLVGTWYHGETLRTLMISIMTDWMTSTNNWERNTMLNIAKRGRTLSVRCFVTMTGTVTFYICLNLLKFYRSVHQPQRNLVYRFSYPYNTQNTPNYEITFFTQLSGGMYSAMINCTIDTFISILVLHICAQLINLRMALNNLVDELAKGSISSSRFKKGLIAITIRHEHLIRNANTVDKCYSAVLFVHMLAATFQLCFESFQVFTIITSHLGIPIIKITFLSFYFSLVLTHLYFYCYSAEKLSTESTNMANGVYECKWYDIPPRDAKNLLFMIYRSTIPLKLTAGKFGTFSLEMFGTTVKTSMGYLSVLLTMMDYLNYMFTLTRQWLWVFGIWPDPHMSLSDFRWPNIRFIIIICNISLYVSAPQMMNVIRAWGNLTRMVENFVSANFSLMAICKLLVTWYHGKKIIQKSPNYEITYIIQLFGGAYSVFANYMIDSFVSVLVLHICSQLINLRLTMNNMVNELANNSISSSRKERFKKDLAAIVVRHEHLIRNAKTINGCYSSVLFMNLLFTTLQMCFIAFQFFMRNIL
ncbi:PREDICTED: odorant receptor 45b-like [Trachymyrmex septentrionalis]|uniref:odorant receptor 45b-like n=1 Tax=Trachymyrmex septentrionalis TaxID=34720 RepID=UPI00084F435B|nr:PREDICTED: odorant receptor 45b-like [Trachymyrmex septentrionalis]